MNKIQFFENILIMVTTQLKVRLTFELNEQALLSRSFQIRPRRFQQTSPNRRPRQSLFHQLAPWCSE